MKKLHVFLLALGLGFVVYLTWRIGVEELFRQLTLLGWGLVPLILAEGVAERATDVDVALVNGYGFPRWEGGPVFCARERGEAALRADLDRLADVSGPGFVRGDLRHVLG